MKRLARWFRSLVLHRRLERDMRAEMRQHLDRATKRFIERGMSADEARRAALKEFGNLHYLQEEARDVRGGRWLGALTPDAKLALRLLVKRPVLNLVGGLGMAVAIAASMGFFTFMAFYYSDAPVEDGDRVVTVDYIAGDDERSTLFDYQLWQDQLGSLENLAAYRTVRGNLESPIVGSGPAKIAQMTASGFRLSRVPPLLGRPLLDADEVEGAPPVIVIGFREWHQRFGADPDVVGSEVRLDGIPHTVVGVMPEGFRLPVNHGLWTALVPRTSLGTPADGPEIHVFGRLAPGITVAMAEAEASVISDRMIAEHPQIYEGFRAVVRPYIRHTLDVQWVPAWAIWLMQLFATLILIAVAVNVAVLFYARTAQRRAEIAIRTALGASRGRIVTQLFLEALALSTVAAGLGLLIARFGFSHLTQVEDLRDNLPYWLLDGLPPETIPYAALLAALAAFVVGALPALPATGRHLESTLREVGGGTGLRMGKTWTALICIQVAVAVGVLPAVVGVAWNYAPPPTPTFPASEILSFGLQAPPPLPDGIDSRPSNPDSEYDILQAEFFRRVEALTEVDQVTFSTEGSWSYVEVEDSAGRTEVNLRLTRFSRVGYEFFDAMGVSVLAGRTFDQDDAVDGTTATVVNRAFVDEHLEGGAALGRRFREVSPNGDDVNPSGPWFEVVGVIETMLLPAGRGQRASPQMYLAADPGTGLLSLVARTNGTDPATVVPQIREIAAEIAPGFEIYAGPLDLQFQRDPGELRFLLLMVGFVTLSVLLLSAAGISAMMSFAVTQRRREVGIRTALGASHLQVVASIFSRSIRQLGIGLLIGAVGAAFIDWFTGGAMLDGQAVPLLGIVAGIMLLSGLVATLGPARRALRIQPMEALREE